MAFIEDLKFPTGISKGSRGGPGHNHSIFEADSGEQNVINRWPRPRRMYNARYGIRSLDDLRVVHNHYLAAEGVSNGFRWEDIFDHTTNLDGLSAPDDEDAVLGQGDDSRILFQLVKEYTTGTTTHVRALEKPVNGSVVVALNGVPQVETTDYIVDYSTGTIQFVVAPTISQEVTAGCQFDVPVQYAAAVDALMDVSLDGFTHGQIPDIPVVEMVGQVATPRQSYRGGGSTQLIDINTAFDYTFGHSVTFVPSVAGIFVTLPTIDDLSPGTNIFHWHNGSATDSLDFRNREAGALEFTIPADQGAIVGIRLTGTTKNWIAFLATVAT